MTFSNLLTRKFQTWLKHSVAAKVTGYQQVWDKKETNVNNSEFTSTNFLVNTNIQNHFNNCFKEKYISGKPNLNLLNRLYEEFLIITNAVHSCSIVRTLCSWACNPTYIWLFLMPNPGLVSDTQGTVVQKRILPETTERCKLIY